MIFLLEVRENNTMSYLDHRYALNQKELEKQLEDINYSVLKEFGTEAEYREYMGQQKVFVVVVWENGIPQPAEAKAFWSKNNAVEYIKYLASRKNLEANYWEMDVLSALSQAF